VNEAFINMFKIFLLTEQPVDGVRIKVDERREDVHHAENREGQKQQGQHRLLGAGNQALKKPGTQIKTKR
jgi:hypothetical protein